MVGDPVNATVVEQFVADSTPGWADRDDPLLRGPVPAPPGAQVNDRDQVSPAEPTRTITGDPAADPTGAPSR